MKRVVPTSELYLKKRELARHKRKKVAGEDVSGWELFDKPPVYRLVTPSATGMPAR